MAVDETMNPAMDEEENLEELESLVIDINSKFQSCTDKRSDDEDRWLQAYHNYRGKYYKNIHFTEHEKSRVFVKVTKTKVLAAYGQIIDVLFGTGKFPLTIEETVVPEGIDEYAHMNPMKKEMGVDQIEPQIEGNLDYNPQSSQEEMGDNGGLGFPGDGNDLPPGATFNDLGMVNLGGLKEEFEEADLSSGPSPVPEMPQIKPAQIAARRLHKLIEDQLDESDANVALRSAIFESCLLGTGIIKGPFTYNKTLHKYSNAGNGREYQAEQVKVPKVEFVSIWDFYPDPNARNMEEAEYVIQRHRLNRHQFKDLLNRPYFNKEAIYKCLEMGPKYDKKSWETSIDAENNSYGDLESNRYEVLEYWGTIDAMSAREQGLDIDEEIEDFEEVQVNIWTTNGKVIRIVENPFTPFRIPYQSFSYETNPYQFFGIGVPENMDDAQAIMNGHARMAIDNLALAGNLVFDVDETMLVPGQDMKVFPGKIFRRQSGQPGQAIHGVKFPNTANENLMMFDRFRQLADEATGIPSYSHGTTGVQSTTRTAAGMSMLMGAAALSIKTVIKNIDDYLLKPLGNSLFHWNMQFNSERPEIQGDLDIKAQGTSSLMQKEVRSQRLMTFMQTASNPSLAPFVKWHTCLKEVAKSLDIDPDQLINDPEKAAIYAHIMGMANGNQTNTSNSGQPGPVDNMGGVPPGASPTDPTGNGGGNIGTGNVPMPGEAGFTSQNTQPKGNN